MNKKYYDNLFEEFMNKQIKQAKQEVLKEKVKQCLNLIIQTRTNRNGTVNSKDHLYNQGIRNCVNVLKKR